MKFVGELPPDARGRSPRGAWRAEAAKLRERPNEWAILHTCASRQAAANMALNIRRGRLSSFAPAAAFEATQRGLDVYARYVGEAT